jgi:hypothetical protein
MPSPSLAIIEQRIFRVRGRSVMFDVHVAELYGVSTKIFNQAIKRNYHRFPEDFMCQLTEEEMKILRSQIVTSRWGGRRYAPYVFTEQGVAMLSSVLKSNRAVQVNIAIMRAFVKLRETMALHADLAMKIKELESKYDQHDEKIQAIFMAIRTLLNPPERKKKPMGFSINNKEPVTICDQFPPHLLFTY